MSKGATSARSAPAAVPRGWLERLGGFDRRLALGLALAVIAVYARSFGAGFIWDDDFYVEQNPTVQSAAGLWRIWFDVGVNQQYYPLVHTSFWLEARLWGADPTGFHVVNVLLHALGAVLAYRVLARLRVPGAWLAAAIWALHPVQVESVAWITERKNVLSAVFYFASALTYLRWAGEPDEERARGKPGEYLFALALFACALLCKTVTCTLPAALLLVLWWKRGRLRLPDLRPLAPFFLVGAGLGLLTVWVERVYVGADDARFALEPLERVLIAGRAPWFYLGKILWPSELAFIHPRWVLDPSDPLQLAFPLATVALLALLVALRRRIGRGPLTAMLFFGGTLFPALGFFSVYPFLYSFVADHFQYLASLGPIALIAALVTTGLDRARAPLAPGALGLGALLVTLAALTFHQEAAYRDLETLWRDTLAKNPDAPIAHTNLGNILFRRGEPAEAERHWNEALRIDPTIVEVHLNLVKLSLLRNDHGQVIAHAGAGLAALPEPQDDPPNSKFPWLRQQLQASLGAARLMTGDPRGARSLLEAAAATPPDTELEQSKLGTLEYMEGREARAVAHLRRALELQPDSPGTARLLAWIYSTANDRALRDALQAVTLAELAVRTAGGGNAVQLHTLAVAYSTAGRFDEATDTARRALAQLASGGPPGLADDVRRSLALYEAQQPYE